jgi:hypothetical protein
VLLLTTPEAAGYTQNPISVYYCYGGSGGGGAAAGDGGGGAAGEEVEEGALVAAIAEVRGVWGANYLCMQPKGHSALRALKRRHGGVCSVF